MGRARAWGMVALVGVALGSAASAWAALPRRSALVLVVPVDGAAWPVALAIGGVATARLADVAGASPLPLEEALEPGRAARRAADLADGEAAVARGLGALAALDLDLAAGELESGASLLLAHVGALPEPAVLALGEALFGLGAAALFEGQEPQADAWFAAWRRLAPGTEPAPGRYPANVLARARRPGGLAQGASGRLRVSTATPGARVLIDGALAGAAPLEPSTLPPGVHAVTVEAPGHRPVAALVPVEARRTAAVELELEPVRPRPEPVSPDLLDREPDALSLGRRLALDRLVIARLEGTGPSARLRALALDVPGARALARVGPLDASGPPAEVAAAMIAALAAAEAPAARAPEEGVAGVASAPALTGRWWFWALVGGATAAAVSTALVLAAEPGAPGPARAGFVLGL